MKKGNLANWKMINHNKLGTSIIRDKRVLLFKSLTLHYLER